MYRHLLKTLFFVALLWVEAGSAFAQAAPDAKATTEKPPAAAKQLSEAELDNLTARIALYPLFDFQFNNRP